MLDRALALKAAPFSDRRLEGPRTVSILFDKPTLRTQVSFVGAVAGLGGYPMVVDGRLAGVGVRESVADVARILGPQSAAVVWRTFGQGRLEEMAALRRRAGRQRPHRRLPPVPDPRRPAHRARGQGQHRRADPRLRRRRRQQHGALLPARRRPRRHARARRHPGRRTRPGPTSWPAREAIAAEQGGSVLVTDDPVAAVAGADVVATDTWVSMGLEAESEATARAPTARSPRSAVTEALMAQAAADAVFLHCLPAYRGLRGRRRGDRRPAVRGLGGGREPAARAEGPAVLARSSSTEAGEAAMTLVHLARRAPAADRRDPRVAPRCARRPSCSTTSPTDGIEVTQATLSRDLVDVGAERVRVGKNLVYAVPGEGGDRTVRAAPDGEERVTRLGALPRAARLGRALGQPGRPAHPARGRELPRLGARPRRPRGGARHHRRRRHHHGHDRRRPSAAPQVADRLLSYTRRDLP